MINYRYYEILKTLQEQPGLTTGRLLKECRSKPGSELPNGVDVISKIIYSLRQSELLTSSDAAGGKVHKITSQGESAITEYENFMKEHQHEPEVTQQETEVKHTEQTLDELLEQIRAISTKAAMPAIQDKEKKIATLLKIGALMHDDIAAVIEAVIDDLERF